jgi:phosphatidate cytidylyltransferase
MLKNRVITALLLGGVFLGALYFLQDAWWAIFLLVFVVIGAWEWSGLSGFCSTVRSLFVGLTLLVGLALLPDIAGMELFRYRTVGVLLTVSTVFWLTMAPLWLMRHWHISKKAVSFFLGWLLLLPTWAALVDLRHTFGPHLVLILMLVIVLADSFAYFSGKRFGRRKLAPEISPGKTWEGLIGALLGVGVFSLLVCLTLNRSLWFALGCLALTLLSVVGDLFESLMKRQAGKKDSGNLLPGHGGVLDRIDGLTSTLPLVAWVTYLPFYMSMFSER